jgi:hypothetical protein
MLKFLLGNAKIRNASVPKGVASDKRINFSPVRSPRNRQAEKRKEEKIKFETFNLSWCTKYYCGMAGTRKSGTKSSFSHQKLLNWATRTEVQQLYYGRKIS